MHQYAPVLICTMNRYIHFKRCVESLAKCEFASETDLFIGFDYPLKEKQFEGYSKIKAFLTTIDGFKSINIVYREKNFGVHDNWTKMIEYVYQKYDKIIIAEDDLEFSNTFLSFLNKGLDTYEKRKDIFAICGYCYPVNMPKFYSKDVFIWQAFAGWGFAIWKNRAINTIIDLDLNVIFDIMKYNIKSSKIVKRLNSIANHLVPILKNVVKTGDFKGDIYYCLHMTLNDLYCVFPIESRVRNTGHDGSGINCGALKNDIYAKQSLQIRKSYDDMLPFDVGPDKAINKVLYNFFKISIYSIIKNRIRFVLSKIKRKIFNF